MKRCLTIVAILIPILIALIFLNYKIDQKRNTGYDSYVPIHSIEKKSWEGTLPNSKSISHGPFISDKASWTKVWKSLHGDKKLPEVDFTKFIIYNRAIDVSDPNSYDLTSFYVNGYGELKNMNESTAMDFESTSEKTRYIFVLISSAKVKSY